MPIDEMLALNASAEKISLLMSRRVMTVWEKRAQAMSFTVGNLKASRNHVPPDEWMALKWAAETWDIKHGTLIEMEAE